MQIAIEYKDVYGKTTMYPANAEAKVFAELLGQKTLTQRDVSLIRKLGYKINRYSSYQPELTN